MKPFRTLVAGLCTLAIAGPAVAQGAGVCLRPAEKTAFDVHTLQTALMVAALNCKQEDEYNGFVTRFRSDLGGAYRNVAAHFRRTGGGVRRLDDHITNLANAHSQDSIRQGSLFCQNVAPMWQRVMALRTGADLAQFSTTNSVTQIYAAQACTGPAPTVRAAATPRPAQPARVQQARATTGATPTQR